MSYEQMAYVYDELMEDVPYDEWLQYVKTKQSIHHVQGKKLLDVACGTGNLTVRYALSDYDVTGIDLSEDMLTVAQMKLNEVGKQVPLFVQDMSQLNLMDRFDIVTIFCDSLCYLDSEEAVKETFKQAYAHLNEGGLFLFDVHSLYKMNHIFADATFTVNQDDVALIWYTFMGQVEHSVEHELTFFVRNEEATFERFEETHFQRTYEVETLKNWVEDTGFKVQEICGDFDQPIHEKTERIFFCCTK